MAAPSNAAWNEVSLNSPGGSTLQYGVERGLQCFLATRAHRKHAFNRPNRGTLSVAFDSVFVARPLGIFFAFKPKSTGLTLSQIIAYSHIYFVISFHFILALIYIYKNAMVLSLLNLC